MVEWSKAHAWKTSALPKKDRQNALYSYVEGVFIPFYGSLEAKRTHADRRMPLMSV